MQATLRIASGVLLSALATAALSAQGAPAAGPSTAKGVVLKGKAPVSEQVLTVQLPRPQAIDLPNGLHLMVLEDHRVPQVTFTLIIPGAGGYYDPEQTPGLATFTAAMLREGTPSRSSGQISEQLETMAATLNINTGMSSLDATVNGSALTEYLDRVFDLAADVVLNPAFPEQELARYQQRTQAQLVQQRSNPGFLASELFSRVTYGNHPAARISPTIESLKQLSRAALVEFHQAHYLPDHAALAIAGDISPADARKLVEAKFGGWKKAGTPAPVSADPPPPGTAKVSFVDRQNSVQTNFVVGTQAIERTNPDYDALQVMNKIIGGGPTGRLFLHLREEKGYTYGAYSGLSAGRFRGSWNASTEVRTEVTEPALRDLLADISHMRDSVVPTKELRDQQRSLVASFALSLESPQQVLGYYITSWTYQLPADYWDKYPERVMAVTQAQVQNVARKYLEPGRLQIVAVGDGAKVEPVLKRFGPVVTYDTEGRTVQKPLTP
ncbi:MAG: insulinase family protein [Gemmatimonadetes bacterium]|nr:insulinase family protein [Gemmatimonadota bacterium]